jgi:ATP-binding cassette, subfamily B, bacterial
MRELLSAAWFVMRLAWRTGPRAVVFTFGEVVSTVLTFLQPAMVGLIVGGLASHAAGPILYGTALLVASLACGGALEALAVGHRVKLIEDVGYAFDIEVMRSLARITDLDRLEQPELAAAIAKVRDRRDAMGFCFNGLMTVLIQAAAPVASVSVAVAIDPRLLLVTLAGLPALLAVRRTTKMEDDADKAASPHATRAVAWSRLIPDADARAERRVFGLWDWYQAGIGAAITRRDALFLRPADIESAWSLLADLFYLACAFTALLWILTTGHLSAGRVAAALLVTVDLKGTLGALRYALSGLGPSLRAAVALRGIQQAAASVPGGPSEPQPGPESGGYRLAGVSYEYAGAAKAALRNLDLAIEPGQVVAIVGANGAGKSTLTEILTGLRNPSSGLIARPQAVPSVIAQRFGRYQFRLAEAVCMADLPDLDAAELVSITDCLDQASPDRFWDDITVQLGPDWPDGIDLSAGQWQSVAAARCFYVSRATLVVLDEPTAALDPLAQGVMAVRYSAITREVAERGGIAVVVTHRMSMPRLADQIIVLDEGEIAETGTHQELIALNGRYAQAYRAQASGFMQMASEQPDL